MNLATTLSLYGGGLGSGCHGPNCGRPITAKMYREMRKYLRKQGIKIPRGVGGFDIVKAYDAHRKAAAIRKAHRLVTRTITKKAKANLQKAIKKGKLGKKTGTTTPGLTKKGGAEHIDIKPVWKGKVVSQYTATGGHLVTEIKTPKEYEKSGKSWIGKPSKFKGQFLSDSSGAFNQTTINNPKERNSFWIHQASPDLGVSVEIHRNLGELKAKVIERTLGAYDTIIQHREVEFKNIGRASGFLNRRYGITFKLSGKN